MFKEKISKIDQDKELPYKYDVVFGKDLHFGLFKDCLSPEWPQFVGKKVSVFLDRSKQSILKILTSTGKTLYPTTGEYKTSVQHAQDRINDPLLALTSREKQEHYNTFKNTIPFVWQGHFDLTRFEEPPYTLAELGELARYEAILLAGTHCTCEFKDALEDKQLRGYYENYYRFGQHLAVEDQRTYEEYIDTMKDVSGYNDEEIYYVEG